MASTTPRLDNAQRWQAAARRAVEHGIVVEQDRITGDWWSSSASEPGTWYLLIVHGNIVSGCLCAAGQHGNDVCHHKARFYQLVGALPETFEPEPSEPAPAMRQCPECSGGGVIYVPECARYGFPHPPCFACDGTGEIPVSPPAQIVGYEDRIREAERELNRHLYLANADYTDQKVQQALATLRELRRRARERQAIAGVAA